MGSVEGESVCNCMGFEKAVLFRFGGTCQTLEAWRPLNPPGKHEPGRLSYLQLRVRIAVATVKPRG